MASVKDAPCVPTTTGAGTSNNALDTDEEDAEAGVDVGSPSGRSTVPRWWVALRTVVWALQTEKSWITIMFILGTLDMLLNLINFIQVGTCCPLYTLVQGCFEEFKLGVYRQLFGERGEV